MKRKIIALSRRYEVALAKHLQQPAGASLAGAQGLGRRALAIGIEMLDMARIHEEALVSLSGSSINDRGHKHSNAFFAEAINPIEETHVTAREARVRSIQLEETLQRRTLQLAASNQRLQHRIVTRRTAEAALRLSGERQTKLLKESFQLQQRLRRLTHRLLASQENERLKMSRGLQDEIAQTLLGINVRLLSLKTGAKANAKGLRKDIASTQQLVVKSAKAIHRVARGFEQSA
jgi:signal transduction histidine kinase